MPRMLLPAHRSDIVQVMHETPRHQIWSADDYKFAAELHMYCSRVSRMSRDNSGPDEDMIKMDSRTCEICLSEAKSMLGD